MKHKFVAYAVTLFIFGRQRQTGNKIYSA